MANGAIYIPAFNVATTLPQVLDRIPEKIKREMTEIFVLDNDSSDGTPDVALEYKKKHDLENLMIISNGKNLGYGGSQKQAYLRALKKGYDFVVMIHGDGQHPPEHVEALIQPILEGRADVVFGSRMSGHPLKGGMPLHRFVGNRILTHFQNKILGSDLSEFHSGFRVYSARALECVPFELLTDDYHFDTEIFMLFIEKNLRIKEIPVPTHYGLEERNLNIWRYGFQIIATTLFFFLQKRGLWESSKWRLILKNLAQQKKTLAHGPK